MSERRRYRTVCAGGCLLGCKFKGGNSILEPPVLVLRPGEPIRELVDLDPLLIGFLAQSGDLTETFLDERDRLI